LTKKRHNIIAAQIGSYKYFQAELKAKSPHEEFQSNKWHAIIVLFRSDTLTPSIHTDGYADILCSPFLLQTTT
jgi:hypothetical protein